MSNEATPIGNVTKSVISELSGEKLTKEERIKKIWQKAAGRKFSGHTQPASFKKKRLVINVDSSGWLFELTMKKDKIKTRLNRMLKENIEELRFRIGEVER